MKRRDLTTAEGLAILKDYGMPYKFIYEPDLLVDHNDKDEKLLVRPSWNGRDLAVSGVTRADGLIHELGHWLVCPKWRRSRAEFGLGMSFRSNTEAKRLITNDYAEEEEKKVCAFEIAAYWKLGFNWRQVARSVGWYAHEGRSWEDFVDHYEDTLEVVGELRRMGIFKKYAPVNFPRLEELDYHIKRAQKEIEEWKQQSFGRSSAPSSSSPRRAVR